MRFIFDGIKPNNSNSSCQEISKKCSKGNLNHSLLLNSCAIRTKLSSLTILSLVSKHTTQAKNQVIVLVYIQCTQIRHCRSGFVCLLVCLFVQLLIPSFYICFYYYNVQYIYNDTINHSFLLLSNPFHEILHI